MEARELASMATSEHFLDPEQNATKILIEMRRVIKYSFHFLLYFLFMKHSQTCLKWHLYITNHCL
jgi:hypothetical protein